MIRSAYNEMPYQKALKKLERKFNSWITISVVGFAALVGASFSTIWLISLLGPWLAGQVGGACIIAALYWVNVFCDLRLRRIVATMHRIIDHAHRINVRRIHEEYDT